jgi:hypothetical protein
MMVGIDESSFMVREQSTNNGGEDERCVDMSCREDSSAATEI